MNPPGKKLSDAELLAHRRQITTERPSLPQRAGKALTRCQANVTEFNERPPVPYVHRRGVRQHRPKGEHHIVVRGVARADFELQSLVKLAQRLK
ncbi:hypothetical protein B5P44_27015 [Mycobacterium sp. CBMA 213]|nr:hypothetical protein [Mycolicibacterium sp. CBMA 213]